MSNDKIPVFIADDSEMVIEAITALTASDPSIEIVGPCGNGLEVLDQIRASQPKVLVLDISLPGLNGLEVCRLLKAQVPMTSVLMLSMHTNERCVLDALRRGASAYIGKESVAEELCEAVHAISRGEIYLGQGIPRSVLALMNPEHPASRAG